MSSLQVDSISSMGGGHVDGAGKVVQFKEAFTTTQVDISNNTTATIVTLDFTPKFSDSLILCQAVHNQDACAGAGTRDSSRAYLTIKNSAGTYLASAGGVGYLIDKSQDARFSTTYSGTTPSWGTTSETIRIDVLPVDVTWTVSKDNAVTSLYVWELAQ